ncbi:MAG TPA: GIY-YIG nuclease family protein [Dehalococcoidales bacterium]|nr:GIY-YIG nuclease family protein [Dehalococcoidales bacterium]
MMRRTKKQYFVYIMSNLARTLYVGVTNDLERRVTEHKNKTYPGFTSRYGLTDLVYFEAGEDVFSAITREKQIKCWLRRKKIELIETTNPEWKDLSNELFDCHSGGSEETEESVPFRTGNGSFAALRMTTIKENHG